MIVAGPSVEQAWRDAVESLRAQIERWAPGYLERSLAPYREDSAVSVLVLSDPEGPRTLTLEPASYRLHKLPAAVDVYSSTLSSFRFLGPYEETTLGAHTGSIRTIWQIYTSDNVPLALDWSEVEVARLLESLLRA